RYTDGRATADELRITHAESAALCRSQTLEPNSPRGDFVAVNAAIAADWVSVEDEQYRSNDGLDRIISSGNWAPTYIAGSASKAAFYAAYEGADARTLAMRLSFGLPTPANPIWDAEQEAQANLLRCIFGNPFRPASVNPFWLAWND